MLLVNNKKSALLYSNEGNDYELGKTSVVEHSISAKDVPPVSINSCRISYALKGKN